MKPKFFLLPILVMVLVSSLVCNTISKTATATASPTGTPKPASTYTPTLAATSTVTSRPSPSATNRATVTATSAQGKTATPTQVAKVVSCPGAPDIKLNINDWAIVSKDPPIPNRVRSQPNSSSETIGSIQPGETMLIEDGPRCADGYAWWYAHSFNGLEGWTAEGDAENYWLIPLKPVSSKWTSFLNPVTLTSDQVRSAVDVEAAITSATAEGTRPGTVILDGRKGPFVFTGADRSVNIFVSNLTLLGVNQAVIKDCDDGLFFDFPLKNILVEGIEFVCKGSGVANANAIKTMALRNNIFRTGSAAISMSGESSDWLIVYNLIETHGGDGIQISGAKSKIVIVNNHITSINGIRMQDCSGIQVRKNLLHAQYDGIVLTRGAMRNLVERNTILGIYRWGIFLVIGVEGNQILNNTVFCRPNHECSTVFAADNAAEINTIEGNRP